MSQNLPGTSVSSYATEAEGGSKNESDDEVGVQALPLTKQISNILKRYPEGGQILKVCFTNYAHNNLIPVNRVNSAHERAKLIG